MEKHGSIFVGGHRGLVGSAILRRLRNDGFSNIVTRDRAELDLTNQAAVQSFFQNNNIDYVMLAAARVGGVHANNTYQVEFLYENLMIACNVIHSAAQTNVKKLLFLGSTCIYPRMAEQPVEESALLTGPLEPTNEAYALAKISGLKLCEKYRKQYGKCFISAMPTNLYGPQDNFHPSNSHVIPGLLRKFHEAKISRAPFVEVWGTGSPRREFLHVDDLADALYLLMNTYEEAETINVGSGQEITIARLAELIREIVGYKGDIKFNTNKPDGAPRKVCDPSRLHALGWSHRIELKQGLTEVYDWALRTRAFD